MVSPIVHPGELNFLPLRPHSHRAEAKPGWNIVCGSGVSGEGGGATTAEAQLLSGKYWI